MADIRLDTVGSGPELRGDRVGPEPRRQDLDRPFLAGLCDVVREVMGDAYPQLHEERDTIAKWDRAGL